VVETGERLVSAPTNIASAHVVTNVPVANPLDRASDVRRALVGRAFDSAVDVAVCEGDRLLGLLAIERLLAAPDDARVDSLMDDTPVVVVPGIDQEIAAWKMVNQNKGSLAVIDEAGRFVGLVPPFRMLGVLLHEHVEDLARLGGYLHDTESARTSSAEAIRRRLRHRLPWLLIGLAGAMLAAVIVGGFEDELNEHVILAFFVPGIVYMADAVGTQTETLVIRGLSCGVPIRAVVRREILTGLLIGTTLAALFLPFALVVWGEPDIAIAVAVSLFASCSIATAVALALPSLLHRLGRDPAFGSGPLATVIQDLLSLLIYFWIAQLIV
jgi:magnesium transporter